MLSTSGAMVPTELNQEVLVLDEPLPTAEELTGIVDQIFTDSKVPKPNEEGMSKAAEAIVGLSAFESEQRTAMCLSRSGLGYDDLWERKRQAIEQVRGLSVWRGAESLDGIGGYEALKQFLRVASSTWTKLRNTSRFCFQDSTIRQQQISSSTISVGGEAGRTGRKNS
jgi:hypothetical protein